MASNSKQQRPAPKPGGGQAGKGGKNSDLDMMISESSSGSGRKLPWVWVIVGALVVLAGVIAVLSAGGDEKVTVGTVAEGGGSSSPGEVQPVTVTGDALVEFQVTDGDPAVGETAPALDGFNFDGSPVSIGPDGTQKMVVFLAHWCPHCNREVPVLNEWKDAGLVPEGLQVVGISTAASPEGEHYPPSEWIDQMDWTWPVMADSETQDAALAFGLSGYPTMVILDGDGTVLSRASGEKTLEQLQQFVDDALASAA